MALLSGRTSFQAHWPVRWSAGTTSPVGVVSASTRVTVPLSSSGTSSSRAKTRWAPGHGHDHKVHLLADLDEGLGGILVQGEEGDQGAQSQGEGPAQGEEGPHHGAEDVADVAQVGVHRHGDVAEGVGFVGAVKELPVALAEALQGLRFVAENLDHLLPVHDLLDVAVYHAQVLLLGLEIVGGLRGNDASDQNHPHHDGHREQGQGNAEGEHGHQGSDQGEQGVDDLGSPG